MGHSKRVNLNSGVTRRVRGVQTAPGDPHKGGGVHTTKRLSGCQQRKAKIKKLRGSMLQYVKGSDEAQSFSKDTVPQPQIDETNLSDAEIELLLEIPRLRRHLKAAEIDLEEAKNWSRECSMSMGCHKRGDTMSYRTG
ncbi:hypothetical protein HELRODRAFT_183606 [Helobdella robusta]|uniref:Uncharacterized protein n=1 Tax=Helobdella robusta TaxID=6412 RepID=T1FJX2_HELRO|nr:hypothetical protein HELRODRAFT_183606 [Helobdella robusta]ESO10448.1 hypothetical protein HELRODRAFT_183606 [Helobdella robusta]